MKILIFEDDYEDVKMSFDLLNIVYYNKSLIIKNASKYQDAGSIEDILKFDFIFVDIALAVGSRLDGFEIIKELLQNKFPINKIAILTGHRDMKARIKSHYIDEEITIILKAITHKSLYEVLKQAFPE